MSGVSLLSVIISNAKRFYNLGPTLSTSMHSLCSKLRRFDFSRYITLTMYLNINIVYIKVHSVMIWNEESTKT